MPRPHRARDTWWVPDPRDPCGRRVRARAAAGNPDSVSRRGGRPVGARMSARRLFRQTALGIPRRRQMSTTVPRLSVGCRGTGACARSTHAPRHRACRRDDGGSSRARADAPRTLCASRAAPRLRDRPHQLRPRRPERSKGVTSHLERFLDGLGLGDQLRIERARHDEAALFGWREREDEALVGHRVASSHSRTVSRSPNGVEWRTPATLSSCCPARAQRSILRTDKWPAWLRHHGSSRKH